MALLTRDHPCVCGEKMLRAFWILASAGSPLRMRGKAFNQSFITSAKGITPAYAGKRPVDIFLERFCQDHPCVCGEKAKDTKNFKVSEGSPLRMRGKAPPKSAFAAPLRITPAYAGKS